MNYAKSITALLLAASALAAQAPAHAAAGIKITEWMYNSDFGPNEFIEITNFGPSAINMLGWSFDDNSQTPGSFSLSALGTIAAGESAIIAEADAASFRTAWGLAASVKIIGSNTHNLSRNDEINIYDNLNALVDRLTYNDQGVGDVDGPRTLNISGNPMNLGVVGANNASQWALSFVGDAEGSYLSSLGDLGNPGTTSFTAPVPEPSTYLLMLGGLGLLGFGLRRRKIRV